eukprot:7700889-Karenia_brevis.AAC.1
MGVRAEGVDATEQEALTAMYDLMKCYEHLCHARLWNEGVATRFPLTLLRVTMRSYAWGRRITLGGLIALPSFARRGIIAGCAAATSELKAYMSRRLSSLVCAHPRVSMSVYIADITLDSCGVPRAVADDVVRAAEDLKEACE